MNFMKMHGLGNDFILIYAKDRTINNISSLAIKMCHRNKGVGADGLVLLTPTLSADVSMRIFNADGNEAEQCGNAVRCVAKYASEFLMTENKNNIEVETKNGIQTAEISASGEICVGMGSPIFEPSKIPVNLEGKKVVNHPLEIGGTHVAMTCISMGNPHAVIEVPDAFTFSIKKLGPNIENHSLFPKKTNVEFITIQSSKNITMRVWERGVGRTMACGSGACAALVTGVLLGKVDREAMVHLEGGDLHINWNQKNNHVYMTGPATFSFEGRWIDK